MISLLYDVIVWCEVLLCIVFIASLYKSLAFKVHSCHSTVSDPVPDVGGAPLLHHEASLVEVLGHMVRVLHRYCFHHVPCHSQTPGMHHTQVIHHYASFLILHFILTHSFYHVIMSQWLLIAWLMIYKVKVHSSALCKQNLLACLFMIHTSDQSVSSYLFFLSLFL